MLQKLQQRKTRTLSQKMMMSVSAKTQKVKMNRLLEFGHESNSDENDSKDNESEEEDELPEGARVSRYGRKVGIWRLRYSG